MSETLATTLVERLEAVGCDREPFTDAHKHCICRLTNEAAREISKLKSQLEEARAAMQVVLDDPALQSVAGWYDSINGLRSVLDAHKEGGKP